MKTLPFLSIEKMTNSRSLYLIVLFFLLAGAFNPSFAQNTENSFTLLEKTFGHLRPEEGSALEPIFENAIDYDDPFPAGQELQKLKDWLQSKEKYIRIIDQAIQIGSIQFPPIDIEEPLFPKFMDLRDASNVKLILARLHIEQQEFSKAFDDLLSVVKLGEMISSGQGAAIIHYMIGGVIEVSATNRLEKMCLNPEIDEKTLSGLLLKIKNSSRYDPILSTAFTEELNGFIVPTIINEDKSISRITKILSIDKNTIFDTDETVRLSKLFVSRIIKNSNSYWVLRDKNIVADAENLISPSINSSKSYQDLTWEFYLSGMIYNFDQKNEDHVKNWNALAEMANGEKNIWGRIGIASSMKTHETTVKKSIYKRTKKNMLRLVIALRIFDKKYIRYPKDLNELLRADIIDAIPLDIFSGKALNYSFDKQIVWSVGSDGNNNQGDTDQDIVISCNKDKPLPSPCD